MLLLLLFASASIFSNLIIQILAGAAVLIGSAAITSFVSRKRTKRDAKKQEQMTLTEEIQAVKALAEAMHTAMIGEGPSALNPWPPPGLVKRVEAMDKRTTKIEETLFTNGDRKNTILDRLARIESRTITGSDPSRHTEQIYIDQPPSTSCENFRPIAEVSSTDEA